MSIDQRIFEYPADTRCIRPQCRDDTGRQAGHRLIEILEHARARPIRISTVLEDHVEIRLPEHREAAYRRRSRHRHQRSEEHKSELQSLMRISYAVFCLNKKNI